jgi:hypothetical protein
MKLLHIFFMLTALLTAPLLATAADDADADADAVTLDSLSWIDRNYIDAQVERIDEIGRLEFGTPVRHNRDDIELLQRIIDKGVIARSDSQLQQALGAVLGNLMAKEFNLVWQVYEDKLGRSRALCIEGTRNCLFPMTMLSRRMATGLMPDVQQIYDYCRDEIGQFQPKNPYDVPARAVN